ncbi:MAG: hypothetical protein Pars92KO_23710 [Parasphingorhabdus sp.]
MIARLVDRLGRALTDRNARSYGPFEREDTAVLALSLQVDVFSFVEEWSTFCRERPAMEKFANFLTQCRARSLPIYHSPLSVGDDNKTSAIGTTRYLLDLRTRQLLAQGGPGADIEPALVAPSDHILAPRSGLNAFVGTGLGECFQQDRRNRLIILGGVVNADLDSSARAAVELDFDVTVLSDLTFAYSAKDLQNTLSITLPRLVARVSETCEILDSLPDIVSD